LSKTTRSDWLLYLFSFGLIVSVALFFATSVTTLPLFDVSIEWTGNSFNITFSGAAEIIVAILCSIGLMWRVTRRNQ